jgi:hypothetical protein
MALISFRIDQFCSFFFKRQVFSIPIICIITIFDFEFHMIVRKLQIETTSNVVIALYTMGVKMGKGRIATLNSHTLILSGLM